MTISKSSYRIAAAIVVAAIAGSAVASSAYAEDRHDRNWHRPQHTQRVVHQHYRRDWHGNDGAYYAPPPVVYGEPEYYPAAPPVIGFSLNLR